MLVAAATSCNAFVLPTGKTMPSSSNPKINTSRETTTSLEAALLPSIVTKLSPPLRNTIVLSTAASAVAVSIYRSHKKKGLPDANFSEPLPEGNLGCPILGNIDFYIWNGLVAPKGTSPAIINKLSQATQKVLAMPALQKKLGVVFLDAVIGSPADFTQLIQNETASWKKVVTDANLTLLK